MRTNSGADHPHGVSPPPAAGLRGAGAGLYRVAAVSSDPGGTNALTPVVRALIRSGIHVWVGTSGPAGSLWDGAGLTAPAAHLADGIETGEAERLLRAQCPDVLVTGAGGFNRIEHTFRLAARGLGVPSVAVLDDRGDYPQRFTRHGPDGLEHAVPDRICAPDEETRNEMIGAGYPPAVVCVTGQPHLEEIGEFFARLSPAELRRRRDAAGFQPDDCVVSFFSENLDEVPEGRPSARRPSQLRTLAVLLDALAGLPASRRRGIRLLVKAHPREDPEPLRKALVPAEDAGVRARLVESADARDLIALSQVVVGVSSMVLLEAALAGKPVVSVQVGHPRIARWWGGLKDQMPVATSRQEVEQMLARALGGGLRPPQTSWRFRGATEAVIRVLEAATRDRTTASEVRGAGRAHEVP